MNDAPADTLLGFQTFDDLIRSIDNCVVQMVEGNYKFHHWTGLSALMPSVLPKNFLEEWSGQGTWALNTTASVPVNLTHALTPPMSPLAIATLQHNVRSVLFAAVDRISAQTGVVEIVDSFSLEVYEHMLTVRANVLTFIVARKMWRLYPLGGLGSAMDSEHYSFGEAVSAMIKHPAFEGVVFKANPDNDSADVTLTREEVAAIFCEQQQRTHQDIIRQNSGFYDFAGMGCHEGNFHLYRKTPPFREGLLSLIADMREPNTADIARWLQNRKKSPHQAQLMPVFILPSVADAVNAQATSKHSHPHPV